MALQKGGQSYGSPRQEQGNEIIDVVTTNPIPDQTGPLS